MEEFIMSYSREKPAREPLSAEKLAEELNKSVELQTIMKGVNEHWRKSGTCMGALGITEAQAAKLDSRINNATVSYERVPFSTYDLTNNNSKIKRLEKNLAEASRGFAGWEFFCGRAEANTELNRLQLFFDEKPNEIERQRLKTNGFKWAPSQGAWQRQLNDNAIYAAGRLDFLSPLDGRAVREHQPQPPAQDAGAR
jgi:hypothetical protein